MTVACPVGWLLLLHAATTLFMVGVIWFVQVVHYPLFSRVGEAEFPEYERHHHDVQRPLATFRQPGD